MDAKNEIVYAMATRPMTYRGLETGTDLKRPDPTDIMAVMAADFQSTGFVAFDGRAYLLASNPDYAIELHDGRGLINLNFATPQLVHRLLSLFDVPEALRNELPDTLADWIDEDDFTRLSGAEKSDYERRNRLVPPNAPLMTPMEVQDVLGWDEVPQLWEADLKSPLFTTCKVSGFNPNTAPELSLLTYVPGLTPNSAAATVEHRQQSPFQHARAFMDDTGVIVPNEAFFFGVTPGNCVIVDLVNRTTNERTRMSLSLMPMSQNQPWQVDYAFKVPTQYRKSLDGLAPANTFPTPETLAPIQPGSERALGQR
jgi:hypothetical protein